MMKISLIFCLLEHLDMINRGGLMMRRNFKTFFLFIIDLSVKYQYFTDSLTLSPIFQVPCQYRYPFLLNVKIVYLFVGLAIYIYIYIRLAYLLFLISIFFFSFPWHSMSFDPFLSHQHFLLNFSLIFLDIFVKSICP